VHRRFRKQSSVPFESLAIGGLRQMDPAPVLHAWTALNAFSRSVLAFHFDKVGLKVVAIPTRELKREGPCLATDDPWAPSRSPGIWSGICSFAQTTPHCDL